MADFLEIVGNLLDINRRQPSTNNSRRTQRNGVRKQRANSSGRRLRLLRLAVEEQQRCQSEAILNFAVMITGFLITMYTPTITIWARNRSTQWWEIDVLMQFTDLQWYENFRMTRRPFQLLCNQLHPYITRNETRMRQPVSVVKLVGLTLYRLATGESFRTISNLFGVGRTTAFDGFWAVCRSISTHLKPLYVKRPKGEEVQRMLQVFELKYGFPMCGGAIDGTHIPIVAPEHYHTDYYNRKGWYSILLQGLVNHELKFIDFDVGHPGKCHDAYVFESSKLYQKLQSGTFYPKITKTIEGNEIPIVILGDSAYSLKKFLMKPYPEGLATDQQRRFNERLSRARILVEHSFGRLKGRWRCIMKRNDSQASSMPIVVTACIVLHNFCETWNIDFEDEHVNNGQIDQPDAEYNPIEGNEGDGELIRETLMQHFINNPYR